METTTLLGLVLPGLATGVGGLALLLVRRPSPRVLSVLLGFTGGVMLAATSFSLLVPALDAAGALWEVVAGFGAGCVLMVALDRYIPHAHEDLEHAELHDDSVVATAAAKGRRTATMLIAALTIHNLPEGLAVGVAFGLGGPEAGLALALAIGIQNMPEGFAAGAPVLDAGGGRLKAAGVALATGLVEPPAAVAAFYLSALADTVLAGGLAFAGGAMLYVVVDELIPYSHARGHEREASIALLAGFALLLVLDTGLAG